MNNFTQEFRLHWKGLIGAAIGLACGVNFYVSISSIFFHALENEFGWSKTASSASILALPISAIMLPIAGRLMDSYGVRWIAFASAMSLSICFFMMSRMDGSLLNFYVVFFLLNILAVATTPAAYTRIVAGTFINSRGVALAIALAGVASMTVILPPVISIVINSNGWRSGYQLLAAITLIGGFIAFLLIRDKPAHPVQQANLTPERGSSIHNVLRSPIFWIFGFTLMCTSLGSIGIITHFKPIIVERGYSSSAAPMFISIIAISVLCSRLVVGWFLDRFQPEHVAAYCLWLSAAGMLIWQFSGTSMTLAVIAFLFLGLSIGAEVDFMAFFCSRYFGMKNYSQIFGLIAIFFTSGIALGAMLLGILHDKLGSYDKAIIITTISLVVAGAAYFYLVRLYHRSLETA